MRTMVGMLVVLVGCGADPAAGQVVYDATCVDCHGATGDQGTLVNGEASKDLNFEIPDQSDAQLENLIQNGIGEMPAQDVSDSEMPDLIAYLRETFPG